MQALVYDVLLILFILSFYIVLKRLTEIKDYCRGIDMKLSAIMFVQAGQLNGASNAEIIAKMYEMQQEAEAEVKFLKIAMNERRPWYKRPFAPKLPKVQGENE